MVYLGQETNLWGGHRIVVGEKQLKLEDATCRVMLDPTDFHIARCDPDLRMGTEWGRESRHQNISDYLHEGLH